MTSYSEKLLQIRKKFLAGLDDRIETIETLLQQATAGAAATGKELHLAFHDTVGNAAMLGFDDIAEEARAAVNLVEGPANSGEPVPLDRLAALETHAASIRQLKTIHESAS
ncbi:Hpt domain-containing protein [Marinibacterium sp. SX1]|uniref:Hpt domain-containing protein n=1 Tax=Marinibacterium sp. SX1 TaxID=3388424 RepID=UPI003D17C296